MEQLAPNADAAATMTSGLQRRVFAFSRTAKILAASNTDLAAR
ncbi:hypothetical protein [Devosia sp. DBB001]|nr:hypothetical protein [Devosia sp. DBB001]